MSSQYDDRYDLGEGEVISKETVRKEMFPVLFAMAAVVLALTVAAVLIMAY